MNAFTQVKNFALMESACVFSFSLLVLHSLRQRVSREWNPLASSVSFFWFCIHSGKEFRADGIRLRVQFRSFGFASGFH